MQQQHCGIKKFDNFKNFNDILNEMEIHLKIYNEYVASIQFYGITQDPETLLYDGFKICSR
ncbi:hypothetical protein Glove_66g163 [Diversispora epigaea]|uniref:Uncharacterized protein n=1 Tax=Diversispora epigaea TaxID=1348612 RepID=A0A397JLG4_9GLOM|nr:hypothetical protein Glove_66g163 [Diversispora epigaea]